MVSKRRTGPDVFDQLIVIGLNHKHAPLEVRERLSFHGERARKASARFLAANPGYELVLLSTCNRTELYAYRDGCDCATQKVQDFLEAEGGFKSGEIDPYLYTYQSLEAAAHLLRVTSGLDSMVRGECEILGQVKDAYQDALQAESCGPILSGLFRRAIHSGKRVRSETEVGCLAPSLAHFVVDIAHGTFQTLEQRKALLVGAGKMSRITARALIESGLTCVLVANRTYAKAKSMAESLGGEVVHFDKLGTSLAEADIVICSTGAPHFVLHQAAVQAALEQRPAQSMLIVDLAVPRDVEPEIGDLAGVTLVDMDGLEEQVQATHSLSQATVDQVETILAEEIDQFEDWLLRRRYAPVIAALQQRAEAICRQQVQKTFRRLGDLSEQEQQAIQAMGEAIARQLLHDPITHLKSNQLQLSPEQSLELFERLFGLVE